MHGGNSCQHDFSRYEKAYPRMHGGNTLQSARTMSAPGLSPHARGKPGDRDRQRQRRGPIPACTGETLEGKMLI